MKAYELLALLMKAEAGADVIVDVHGEIGWHDIRYTEDNGETFNITLREKEDGE